MSWGVAWQSAGRTPDPWIGPDLLTEIRRVADEGATSVVVCPVGFVSDHLEILYDLDIEAVGVARSAGVAFARTRSLNDDPRFLGILAGVVQDGRCRGSARGAAVATGPAPTGVTAGHRPTIAVVGAGIAGLAAAWELVVASDRAGIPAPVVHVLESGDRIGGKLRASRVRRPNGRPGRRRIPGPAARGHRALRRARTVRPTGPGGGLRRLHLGPGPAPADAGGVEPRSSHPLVAAGPVGDPQPRRVAAPWPGTWSPRTGEERRSFGDRSVGEIVGERLGRPVVDRLVDPLIGGSTPAAWTTSARRPPCPC